MTYALQAIYNSEDADARYPALPEGINRHHVEDLLLGVGAAIGLSASLLLTFVTLIKQTKPSDWTSTEAEPVCFVQQTKLARMLDKSERQVRADEATLCRLNLITKQVSGNGSRGRVRHSDGSEYRQGIVFTPLIETYEALVQMRASRERERAVYQTLKRHCSALRRNIKNTLADLLPQHPKHASLNDLAKVVESWPRGYGAFRSEQALRVHHDALMVQSQRADDLRILWKKTSGRQGVDGRPYIQDTTKEPSSVPCKKPVDKRTACKQADIGLSTAEPNGSEDYYENRVRVADEAHKNKFLSALSPWRLKALCSEEMAYYLEYHQGARSHPSEMDFVKAAISRVPELGISESAYREAFNQMSSLQTALCILIIDRNRFHPVTPIKNPGGALRAMTRRHGQGKLNLVGGLIGLSERSKVDQK